MNSQFKLNRINHPRASVGAFLLLVVAFGLFGIWANAQTDISQEYFNAQTMMPELTGKVCLSEVLSAVKISP